MATYRIFCLDGVKIIESCDIEAEDDQQALGLLALRGEKADCELWCGNRLVAIVARGANPLWVDRQEQALALELGVQPTAPGSTERAGH